MKCLNCAEPISDKATFCSDKCRMSYRRRTKSGDLPEQNDPEHTTRTFNYPLSPTDRTFETAKPNYYSFQPEQHTEQCLQCGKKFKTSLKLLRHCSPKCILATLSDLTGDSHK